MTHGLCGPTGSAPTCVAVSRPRPALVGAADVTAYVFLDWVLTAEQQFAN